MKTLGGLITVLQSLQPSVKNDLNVAHKLSDLMANESEFDDFLAEGLSSKGINDRYDRMQKTANYQEMQLETSDQKAEAKKESTTYGFTKNTAIAAFEKYAKNPSLAFFEDHKNGELKKSIANKCIKAIQKGKNEVKLSNKEWELYNHKDYGQSLKDLVAECGSMVTVVKPTPKEKAIELFNDYVTDNNEIIGFESKDDKIARIALAKKIATTIVDGKEKLEISGGEYKTLQQNSSRSLRGIIKRCNNILTVTIKPQTLKKDSQASSSTQNKQKSTTSGIMSFLGDIKNAVVDVGNEIFSSPVQQPMTKESALRLFKDYANNNINLAFERPDDRKAKRAIAAKCFKAIEAGEKELGLTPEEVKLLKDPKNETNSKSLNDIIKECKSIIKIKDEPLTKIELNEQEKELRENEVINIFGGL